MLFDIRGKRKRLIQVVYAFLALLIAFGLVGLGIGGSANGGILDALGLGGGSSNSDPQYQQQIDNANSTLATKPGDTKALLTVARYSYLNGQQQMDTNDQGQPVVTDSAAASFGDATDAWERYLAALPKNEQPNPAVAGLIAQAYENIAGTQQQVHGVHAHVQPRRRCGHDRRREDAEPNRLAARRRLLLLRGQARQGQGGGREGRQVGQPVRPQGSAGAARPVREAEQADRQGAEEQRPEQVRPPEPAGAARRQLGPRGDAGARRLIRVTELLAQRYRQECP